MLTRQYCALNPFRNQVQLQKFAKSDRNEIQFLNDGMQVQISNNPENKMLLRNLYTKCFEELHKEVHDYSLTVLFF